MKQSSGYLLAIIIVFLSQAANAQYKFFTPADAFAIEVSLENTELLRLPVYRNEITSLAVTGDLIIGGTSTSNGKSPYIFTASLSQQEMTEIIDLNDIIPGQSSIRSGFCRWKDNSLIAGTISSDNGGGHLIIISIDEKNKLSIHDIGIPVPGEGVHALTQKTGENIVYGITFPSGLFFSFDMVTRKSKVYSDLTPTSRDISTLASFSLGPESYLSRSLIIDKKGRVLGSKPVNKIFCFIPGKDQFLYFDASVPSVWGREVLGMADSWAMSKDGRIFGGNAGDGQLFELDPETGKSRNLGKPVMMPRMKGLTFGRDGKLWGIAGGTPGYSHLFSYDEENGFSDYGNPEFIMKTDNVEKGILWRGFQFGTITSSEDGKYIILGEEESLSQLMIFTVKDRNK